MCNDRIGINRSRKQKRQPYFCCSYRCSRCALRGSAAVEPVWCNNRNLCGDRNVRQVDSQLLLPLNSLPPIFVSCPPVKHKRLRTYKGRTICEKSGHTFAPTSRGINQTILSLSEVIKCCTRPNGSNESRGKMTNALARVAAVFTVSFLP